MSRWSEWVEAKIPPSHRSRWIVGLALSGLLGVSVLTTSMTSAPTTEATPPVQTEGLLSAKDTRPLGVASLSAALKQERSRNDQLARQMERMETLQEEQKERLRETQRQEKQIETLSREMTRLKQDLDEQALRLASGSVPASVNNPDHKASSFPLVEHPQQDSRFTYGEGNRVLDNDRPVDSETGAVVVRSGSVQEVREASLIRVIESDQPDKAARTPIKLPSTSVLSGVTITGIDAPTAMTTRENPVPVLIRIKREAVLPNYADVKAVKECFMLASGYGDLSSERAQLRGEAITCVRKDNSILETKISGYGVGEDGKAGLKGRLVSRNSKVLGSAMMAGFAQGLAGAFDVNPVPVLSTLVNGKTQYQSAFSSDALQGGAVKGASTAMERLADYYMDLADAIHPVIEIGAGRMVDFVVTEGTDL